MVRSTNRARALRRVVERAGGLLEKGRCDVLRSAITIAVTVIIASPMAHGNWVYPVDPPQPAKITHVRQLINPSVAQIQGAIAPNTRVDIIGQVDASGGQRLFIGVDDVRLNFQRAGRIDWSGPDMWEGFVEIAGHRVELVHLEMAVAGEGRCRGIIIHSAASDIRVAHCAFNNVADGLIADGEWDRLAIEHTSFIDCSDWNDQTKDGGYGLFLEDDDEHSDNLRLADVTVTLGPSSGQHGIRICKVQNALIEDSFFGAMHKRSFWAYGVDSMTVRGVTFDQGSVMFNIKADESLTDRPSTHVRMHDCVINHTTIMEPLQIYCGKGTRDFKMCDIAINSTTSDRALIVGWRSEHLIRNIRWYDGSLTFNGQPIVGTACCQMEDWSPEERAALNIGPIPAPLRDNQERSPSPHGRPARPSLPRAPDVPNAGHDAGPRRSLPPLETF